MPLRSFALITIERIYHPTHDILHMPHPHAIPEVDSAKIKNFIVDRITFKEYVNRLTWGVWSDTLRSPPVSLKPYLFLLRLRSRVRKSPYRRL